ncbi:hypothetical protein CL634_03925 [bacterium]|nr:hypothetical protein [bacterium]
MLEIALVFLLGFVSSFVGSVASGAGLISVPGLLLLGIPPHVALATAKFGGIGTRTGNLVRYFRSGFTVKHLVLPMTIIAGIGGMIGARILIEVDEKFLTKLVGILLIVLLPFLYLRRDIGLVQKNISKARERYSHILYLVQKTWQGFFGPGSGFLSLYVMLNAYGLTILQAKATTRLPGFVSTVASSTVFLLAGLVNFKLGIPLLVGMLFGGYVGAHTAIKKGNAWIKPIIGIFILFVGVKLLFFQ